eukprot:352186-Chlamydomonas_euryale.AAC.9
MSRNRSHGDRECPVTEPGPTCVVRTVSTLHSCLRGCRKFSIPQSDATNLRWWRNVSPPEIPAGDTTAFPVPTVTDTPLCTGCSGVTGKDRPSCASPHQHDQVTKKRRILQQPTWVPTRATASVSLCITACLSGMWGR